MLNSVAINQKNTCMAIGTNIGYRIISLKSLKTLTDQNLRQSVKHIAMYYSTNIILYVTDGQPNILRLYDDFKKKEEDCLEFPQTIKKLIVRLDNLFVYTLGSRLFVINLYTFEERQEVKGIDYFIDFCLEVPVKNERYIGWNAKNSGDLRLYDMIAQSTTHFRLHGHDLKLFCFDRNGTKVASLAKGTLLKVTDLETGDKREFWLNYSDVNISDMVFSYSASYIAVIENAGAIKVLNLTTDTEQTQTSKGFLSKVFKENVFISTTSQLQNSKIVFGVDEDDLYVYSVNNTVARFKLNYDKRSILLEDEKIMIPPV